ncbi:hypothetical protein VDGL01_10507 [Verticillium dahliae]
MKFLCLHRAFGSGKVRAQGPKSCPRLEAYLGIVEGALPTLSDGEIVDAEVLEESFNFIDSAQYFVVTSHLGYCLPAAYLTWWLVPEQRRRYPRLHRMPINILSVAPPSAEPEQQFLGARRTQSWDRLRLSPETLQRLECMGNWFARKLISSEELLATIVEVVEMDDEMDIDFDEEDWDV